MKGFSEWVKQVQRYKLPVIKLISPEHVTHGMVTRVSNTILYIWPLLRESDGCELGLEQWSFCNIYTYEIIMMYIITRAFQVVLEVKKPSCQSRRNETWIQSLGQEDPLEQGMAIHSSILAWRIPRTEEPGGLRSLRPQRVRHDWRYIAHTHI